MCQTLCRDSDQLVKGYVKISDIKEQCSGAGLVILNDYDNIVDS